MMRSFIFFLILFFFLIPLSSYAAGDGSSFEIWLKQFKIEAQNSGISSQTIDLAFNSMTAPLSRVIELDRKQPELTQTLETYLGLRISRERINSGRTMMQQYPALLEQIENNYQVQRRFLAALWGVETSYGRHTGKFPLIHSLATLAFDGRRAGYFRRELMTALQLMEEGMVPNQPLRSSWAGAMGQFQFMPSSYRRFAVDGDRDGLIDLWSSVPDALSSAANYLARSGWHFDQTWGREVRLPEHFDRKLVGLKTRLPLSRWQALGVRRSSGKSLPKRNLLASLITPDGTGGKAYLVYDNFRVLMKWNRSELFALSVGILSDLY